MRTAKGFVIFWLLLGVLLAGCQQQEPDGGPSRNVDVGSRSQLYTFNSNAEGWDTYTMPGDQALFRVNEGALEGAALADQGYIWSLDHETQDDVIINATLKQTEGGLGSVFGVMCRADERGNGYYFLISSDQMFSIRVATDARDELYEVLPWQRHQAIKPGYVTNEIRAVCVEDYLALFINDVFIAEAVDTELSSGQTGVTLAAVDQTAWVQFDQVRVRDAVMYGE
ncbi:MAG: hypothetical protein K8L99_07250 [Anaerolineae bacterium]|nr:hypothetical protein [Anaerolineae bacterium]